MCGGSWGCEALDGLVADLERGAALLVHLDEAGARIAVAGEGWGDGHFVDSFVGADGEALEGEVEELGVGGELGWDWRCVSLRKKTELQRIVGDVGSGEGNRGGEGRIPFR